jgi:hypothetical protein
VDIWLNSDQIWECNGEDMSENAVRCMYQKIERDLSETDKTQGETKDNQKNTVERDRTQCVEVNVHSIMSRNAVEHSVSQIEAIRTLTKGEGTRYNVILCV